MQNQLLAEVPDGHMVTYTGKIVNPLALRSTDICLEDIAHALSNICRFGGHSQRHLSVAEHSLVVAKVLFDVGTSRSVQLWGLFHDAAEAYLGDIPSPYKNSVYFMSAGSIPLSYREVEASTLKAIRDHFGLPWPIPLEVSRADHSVLFSELHDFMPITTPPNAYIQNLYNTLPRGLSVEDSFILIAKRLLSAYHGDSNARN